MKAGTIGDPCDNGSCGRLGRREGTRVHGVSADTQDEGGAGGMKTEARGFKREGDSGAARGRRPVSDSGPVLRRIIEGEGGGEKEKAEEERPQ